MAGQLITITGIAEVQKMLAEAPKSVVARGFLKAGEAGINVFRNELAITTPVRQSDVVTVANKGEKHPGDLKRALMTLITLDSQFRGVLAEVGYGKEGRKANWVEYGHRRVVPGGRYVDSRGRSRKGTVVGWVPAHPFLRPCFDSKADAALNAFAESLAGTLKEGI